MQIAPVTKEIADREIADIISYLEVALAMRMPDDDEVMLGYVQTACTIAKSLRRTIQVTEKHHVSRV